MLFGTHKEPDTIKHEFAPGTHDEYAVNQKKTMKEPPKSQEELDALYTFPDKSKAKKNKSEGVSL